MGCSLHHRVRLDSSPKYNGLPASFADAGRILPSDRLMFEPCSVGWWFVMLVTIGAGSGRAHEQCRL